MTVMGQICSILILYFGNQNNYVKVEKGYKLPSKANLPIFNISQFCLEKTKWHPNRFLGCFLQWYNLLLCSKLYVAIYFFKFSFSFLFAMTRMQWMKTQRWEVNQKLVRLSKNCYKGMYCVYVQAYHKNSINLRRAYKKGGGGGAYFKS